MNKTNHSLSKKQTDLGFFCWSLAMLLVALIAFWPSFFNPVLQAKFTSPVSLTYWHASLIFLWLLLIVIQSILISFKRIAFHQILGLFSIIIAIGMIYTSFMLQVQFMQHYFSLNELTHAVQVPFFRLITLLVFVVCFILSMLIKDRSWHKRLILLGSFALLEAAFARLFLNYSAAFELSGLFGTLTHIGVMAYFVIWDRIMLGHFHLVSLWGSVSITLLILGTAPVAESSWWFEMAKSMAALA